MRVMNKRKLLRLLDTMQSMHRVIAACQDMWRIAVRPLR